MTDDADLRPTTLREMAGLRDSPWPFDESVIVVIDAQRAYAADGVLPLDGVEPATDRIVDLLDAARRAGAPVIHIAHLGGTGSPFDPQVGGRFLPTVEPQRDEVEVMKTLPNAFAGTDLHDRLSTLGRPVVICGFMTHMCVSSTARAALDLGIETTVVADATATRSLALGGDVIAAPSVHAANLAALADRFAVVATTAEILGASSD